MKQLMSLLWKEWFEARLFLAIGLFVFLGLPLIGGLENNWARHFEIDAAEWVLALGGLLAVVVAVGVVVRDLNGRLEEFWRSRPVGVVQWLAVKYAMGLVVVLVVLSLPLVVQLLVNSANHNEAQVVRQTLRWHSLLWMALYSLSFAVASLIRRGAHAAMLAIAVMLLVYFLPTVLPPLHFLSPGIVLEVDPELIPLPVRVEFAVGMIGLSIVGLLMSLLAARYDWRIESDRKLIYWSIGGALLILFSSAAFQLASNLPLLDKQELPAGWVGARFDSGNLIRPYRRIGGGAGPLLCRIHASSTGFAIQPIIGGVSPDVWFWNPGWQRAHPDVYYTLEREVDPLVRRAEAILNWPEIKTPMPQVENIKLVTINLSGNEFKSRAQPISDLKQREWLEEPYPWKDRLYVLGSNLRTFDISDPTSPKLISSEPSKWISPSADPRVSKLFDWRSEDDLPSVTFALPQIPGLPPRQRLDIAMRYPHGLVAMVDDVLVRLHSNHFTTYQLDNLTETSATFKLRGRYDPTPVEEMFGASINSFAMAGGNGLLYMDNRQITSGSMIGAFDVSSGHPKPVGHFALPNDSVESLYLHEDGRLLVAGERQVYLLGPPPHWHR